MPLVFHLITQIPLYSAVITSIALVFGFMSWIKKSWDRRERLFYTLMVLDSVVFVWVTHNMITIG
jgi:hypothetical protein